MKNLPIILVCPSTQRRGVELDDASISLSNRYCQAILAGGGLPWVIPCETDEAIVASFVHQADGVMLTGGEDIQSKLYTDRMPNKLQKKISAPEKERDVCELLIIDEVFRQKKPFLGICRGLQMLNVALGGTLLADIRTQRPSALKHDCFKKKYQKVHRVSVAADSSLSQICQTTELEVNSTHHQALGHVAEPLRVTAISPDGIVEAVELSQAASRWLPFMISVQFHPERLYDRYGEFLKLFKGFVRACAGRRK